MAQPGVVQPDEVVPRVVERGVTEDVGVELRERTPVGVQQDEERGVRASARGRDHDLAHRYARLGGHEEHVGAVLELGRAGDRDARTGIPVEERPPELADESGIGSVASDHHDGGGRTVGGTTHEARLAPRLQVAEGELIDRDPERRQGLDDRVQRRGGPGRADDEAHERRDPPPEPDRSQDGGDGRHRREHRAEQREELHHVHEPARRPDEVGRDGEEHRGGHRQPHHRLG